jgi:hypothetical protein
VKKTKEIILCIGIVIITILVNILMNYMNKVLPISIRYILNGAILAFCIYIWRKL